MAQGQQTQSGKAAASKSTDAAKAEQPKERFYRVNKSFMAYGDHFPADSVFSTEHLKQLREGSDGNVQEVFDPDGILEEFTKQTVKVRQDQFKDAIGSVATGGRMEPFLTERQKQLVAEGNDIQIPIPTKEVKRVVEISEDEYKQKLTRSSYGEAGRRFAEMQEFV